MEFQVVLEYVVPSSLVLLAVVGLSFLKAYLLGLSKKLSRR